MRRKIPVDPGGGSLLSDVVNSKYSGCALVVLLAVTAAFAVWRALS